MMFMQFSPFYNRFVFRCARSLAFFMHFVLKCNRFCLKTLHFDHITLNLGLVFRKKSKKNLFHG